MGYNYSVTCVNMDWGEIPPNPVRYSAVTDAQGQTTIPQVLRDMIMQKQCVDWEFSLATAP